MAHHTYSRTIAALLTAAVLVAPSVALAGGGPDIAPQPSVVENKGNDQAATKATLAEVKVTREEAIAAVTKLFPIPKEMSEPNASLNQSKESASWQLEWRTPSKQANQQSIYASVDAMTGVVTNYSRNGNTKADATELKYSRTEANKLAVDWLAKVAPNDQKGIRFVDDPLQYGFYGGDASYRFHWDRMEQGYPVNGDGIDIIIDARTGELNQFSRNWRLDLTFDLPKTLLEQAKAEQAYLGKLPMQLTWRHYMKPGTDQGEWKLVYRPFGNFPTMSQEGALLDYSGKPIDFAKLTSLHSVPATGKPYVKPDKPMSREAALALAQVIADRKDIPGNVYCGESGEEQKTNTCNFGWYEEKNGVSVAIDLLAGAVNSYNQWRVMDSGTDKEQKTEAKISPEEARKVAVVFIQKFRPDLAGSALVYEPSDMISPKMADPAQTAYHINFVRLVGGVAVADNTGSVDVDAMTGAVTGFWFYKDERAEKDPFPKTESVIQPDAAVSAFLKTQGIEQAWVTIYPDYAGPAYKGMLENAKPATSLVWTPRSVMGVDAIDAVTGVPYDYSGRDLIQAAMRPTDIEGYFAQKEIELLWARGVLDLKDGKFRPDETATASDLARWLVLSRGIQPYLAYDWASNFRGGMGGAGEKMANSTAAPYFGAALQAGIILPEDFDVNADPNAPVSRELFALWATRAMGYSDIVKMENRINMTFSDQAQIGAKYANAAAILNGLKITNGDSAGRFNPQRSITRGEAAKILFAVASKGRSYWM